MRYTFAVVSLSGALLSACGGGGGGNPQEKATSLTEPVTAALNNIADKTPDAKVFKGGFTTIMDSPAVYIEGTSPRNVAENVAAAVMREPAKFDMFYRAMLSDAGLKVSVAGERVGTSGVNNAPIYAPVSVYVVRLTANGVVITGG